ncbi:phosphatase PAP2 family protein [Subtercola sp. YIM 133946]|uniref:phosphatase PAP2 family protein n=1 Tax=Subtercola sp. YIM 133946 TaxID=3118909 RepID=UPI002F927570
MTPSPADTPDHADDGADSAAERSGVADTPDTPDHADDGTDSGDGAERGGGGSGSGGRGRRGRQPHEHFVGRRDVTEWRSAPGQRLAGGNQRLAERFGARRTLVAFLVVGGVVATTATFLAALTYDAVTDRDGIASLDRPALALAKRLRSPASDVAAAGIAYVFGPVGMPVLTLASAAALAARQRRVSPLILSVAAGAGSLIMTVRGKGIVHRNRPRRHDAVPPYESSPSFPSGHTLNATTVAGTLAYLIALQQKRQLPQVAVIGGAAGVVAAVGLSRVLLGAHWLTDVAFGWLSGTGWLALVITGHRLYLSSTADDH